MSFTALAYCNGPLRNGCPANTLTEGGKLCRECERKLPGATEQRQRESERLRNAGWALEIELDQNPIWSHPESGTYRHAEAIAILEDR